MRKVDGNVIGNRKLIFFTFLVFFYGVCPCTSSAATNVSGTIGSNTTWTVANSPYVVTGNLKLNNGVTLTIEPGVIVKFQNGTHFEIDGKLLADGTNTEKIIFTSYSDDSYGGDTNGDGPSSGSPGQWGGINFDENSDDTSRISHAVIRYAGSWSHAESSLYIEYSSPTVEDTVIEKGSASGVRLYSSTSGGWKALPHLDRVTVREHGSHGVLVEGSNNQWGARFADGEISDNGGWGVYSEGRNEYLRVYGTVFDGNQLAFRGRVESIFNPNFTPNTFSNHDIPRLALFAYDMSESCHVYLPSGINQIRFLDQTRINGGVTLSFASGLPPVSFHDHMWVKNGALLDIGSDNIFKFTNGSHVEIDGKFSVNGTSTGKVVLTSYSDDSYGGDTNGDGPSSGSPGQWGGINFDENSDDTSRISHAVIRYAGSWSHAESIQSSSSNGWECEPHLERLTISEHASHGIWVTGDNDRWGAYILDSEISYNGGYGIYMDHDNDLLDVRGTHIHHQYIPYRGRADRVIKATNPNTFDNNTRPILVFVGQSFWGGSFTLAPVSNIDAFYIIGDWNIDADHQMTIEAGAILKFSEWNYSLRVNDGQLTVNGIEASPVVFTSTKDDVYGGDSNYDGSATTGVPGQWGGISFFNASWDASSITHSVIRFAGGEDDSSLYIGYSSPDFNPAVPMAGSVSLTWSV